jgi:hypothetical protein
MKQPNHCEEELANNMHPPIPESLGRSEQAEYKDTGIRCYAENPLVEALPPISSTEEIIKALTC